MVKISFHSKLNTIYHKSEKVSKLKVLVNLTKPYKMHDAKFKDKQLNK